MGIVHPWICRSLPRSSTGTLFVPCAKSSRLIGSTLSTHQSSSGLSNALFASIGTRAKNIAYRGTQAKLKRFDPTYYLGILNPAVEHVVCETKDIEEYLSRFIARKRLTTSTKPFDIDWIKGGSPYAQTSRRYSGRRLSLHLYRATKNRPFKGLTDLIHAFILLDDPRVHLLQSWENMGKMISN